jgi:hypothetical protein
VIEDRHGQVCKIVAGELPDIQAELGGKPQSLVVEENWVPTRGPSAVGDSGSQFVENSRVSRTRKSSVAIGLERSRQFAKPPPRERTLNRRQNHCGLEPDCEVVRLEKAGLARGCDVDTWPDEPGARWITVAFAAHVKGDPGFVGAVRVPAPRHEHRVPARGAGGTCFTAVVYGTCQPGVNGMSLRAD